MVRTCSTTKGRLPLRSGRLAPLTSDPPTPGQISLPKGATFHASTSASPDPDSPRLDIPCLPRRSPTSIDLLDGVGVFERTQQVTRWITSVDRTLARPGSPSSPSRTHHGPEEDLPLPRGMLNGAGVTGLDALDSTVDSSKHLGSRPTETRRRRARRLVGQRHDIDSGLGSSVDGTHETISEEEMPRDRRWMRPPSAMARSAIPTPSQAPGGLRPLSHRTVLLIRKHIIVPLRQHPALNDFRPLVDDLPRQMDRKELLCLRDLEKTLIWSASVSRDGWCVWRGLVAHHVGSLHQARAKSPESYRLFCEASIQCIYTSVGHIGEHEHRRPGDPPYTNGYLVDLVGQVREYARMMAASRQRREAGRPPGPSTATPPVGDADLSPCVSSSPTLPPTTTTGGPPADLLTSSTTRSEEIRLDGGLSQTGRAARLVRKRKDGTTVSVGATSGVVGTTTISKRVLDDDDDTPNSAHLKRTCTDQSPDHSVRRSMARRRKLGPGETMTNTVLHPCRSCSKDFKRPCDLTKHEKTHTRPWKCPEPTCKYHAYGWPTEKECDRHFNDKHSADPVMYKCHFPHCTYRTKRESNCKQHMEKSHRWVYVRAKGNGKKTNQDGTAATTTTAVVAAGGSTPAASTPAPSHDAPTPESWMSNASAEIASSDRDRRTGPAYHPLGVKDGAIGQTSAGHFSASVTQEVNIITTRPSDFRPDSSVASPILGRSLAVTTVPWTSRPATTTAMAMAATAPAITHPSLVGPWADMSDGLDAPFDVDGENLDWVIPKIFDPMAPSQLLTPDGSMDWRLDDGSLDVENPTTLGDRTRMPQPSPADPTVSYQLVSTGHTFEDEGHTIEDEGHTLEDEGLVDGATDFQPGLHMDDFALFDSNYPRWTASTDQGVMIPDLPDGGHHQSPQDPPSLTGPTSLLDYVSPLPNHVDEFMESDRSRTPPVGVEKFRW